MVLYSYQTHKRYITDKYVQREPVMLYSYQTHKTVFPPGLKRRGKEEG